MTTSYDQSALRSRLEALSRRQRAAFAAACAELLAPAWAHYVQLSGRDDATLVADALSELWSSLQAGDRDLAAPLALLEAGMPDEDDDPWFLESGYAQNAASSTAYAIQAWLGGGVQQAEWAARQVWEAADLSAENLGRLQAFRSPAVGGSVAASGDVVATAVLLIEEQLEAVAATDLDPQTVRRAARAAATAWWQGTSG